MAYQIQPPVYPLDSLEPYFDAATMDLHVNKHHQTYADKLNAALASQPNLADSPLEDLIKSDDSVIHNMAGGVLNHNFFWSVLSPKIDQPVPDIFQPYLDQFTASATSLFGSGWTWLTVDSSKHLEVLNLPNQDNPLALGKTPLLALDLWEHSYYLKYQNRRPEYIAAFWHLVNWEQVVANYQSSK